MQQSPLALAILLLFFFSTFTDAARHLRVATCPICDADINPTINVSIFGHQYAYSCDMAGHLTTLRTHPEANLGAPQQVDLTNDTIYKDAHDMTCPVCGKPFSELQYAIPWHPHSDQKIFTCSFEHAQLILANPTKFFASDQPRDDQFCDIGAAAIPHGAAMFDGFQFATSKDVTCALLLFQPWILNSSVKYAFALIGIILLSSSLEGVNELRHQIQQQFFRRYGMIVIGRTGDIEFESPASKPIVKHPPSVQLIQKLPLWCRIVMTGLYMIHLVIMYLIMLMAMSYEGGMFLAVLVGIGLGFFIFANTEAERMKPSVDPCCAT